MFKLDLGKAEAPEIKLPTSVGSQKKQRVPEKHLLYWLCQSLWLCGSQQTGKSLKRWEYQTTFCASWEICVHVKKQQLRLDMEQQNGSKLRKEYVKTVYCHPAYITSMQSTSCEVPGWMKHKLELRLPGEIISDTQMTLTLIAESKEEWKSFLMKMKEESEKAGLKLNIQETKIRASGHIISWQIDGETVKDFIFLGLNIT